jgi:hypothetical protein
VLFVVEQRMVVDDSAPERLRSVATSSAFDPAITPDASVLAAYLGATAATPERIEQELTISEICARVRRDLEAARGSVRRLRALRREVAWLLHPDRRTRDRKTAASLLAGLNAEIDAAIDASNR